MAAPHGEDHVDEHDGTAFESYDTAAPDECNC